MSGLEPVCDMCGQFVPTTGLRGGKVDPESPRTKAALEFLRWFDEVKGDVGRYEVEQALAEAEAEMNMDVRRRAR